MELGVREIDTKEPLEWYIDLTFHFMRLHRYRLSTSLSWIANLAVTVELKVLR